MNESDKLDFMLNKLESMESELKDIKEKQESNARRIDQLLQMETLLSNDLGIIRLRLLRQMLQSME